ncbi:MAG: SDR family oxidoreductase [Thermodesulfobacteriota bacterium]
MMLNGKLCFVSGAARGRGNGRAIALKLAKEGADVVTGDIRYEEALSVAKEIRAFGRNSIAIKMDLSNYHEVEEGFAQIKKEFGPVEILVNNAAIMTNQATISEMSPDAWDKEIAVNLSGAFYCVKQVFNDMVERRWGRIINISSVAGTLGGFGQCSYSSSKAGLLGLTKTIALEGARFGITANAITLGIIGTDAFYDLPEKVREKVIQRVALRKPGDPEDVASLVAFLASDEAKYITGANIMLTGGLDLFVF